MLVEDSRRDSIAEIGLALRRRRRMGRERRWRRTANGTIKRGVRKRRKRSSAGLLIQTDAWVRWALILPFQTLPSW